LSGPGGFAVAAAEACGDHGLKLAKLSSQTISILAEVIPPTGTSFLNPIDVGLTASLNMDIYINSAQALAADPEVDALVVIGAGMTKESSKLYTESMIQISKEFQKPFLIVSIPGFDPELAQFFCEQGVPFFETAERAMTVYAQVRQYYLWRQSRTL